MINATLDQNFIRKKIPKSMIDEGQAESKAQVAEKPESCALRMK